jgi:tripartite-type tricarboxylate transporter receptor subunit TctC
MKTMSAQISGHFAGAVGALVLAVSQSFAQSYPSRPITIVSEHPPGSAPDIVMRAAAQELSPRLGQSMVIDSRPGANGIIAMESCSKAAPNGHTVCLVNVDTMSFAPHVFNKLPYDPERDYRPVARLFFLIQALMAPATLQAASVKELEQMAIGKPGSLNFGTVGEGTQPDVFRRFLAERWNTEIVGIPYKGSVMVASALATGEIQLSMIGVGSAIGLYRSGKIRYLAIATPKRYKLFPDVPVLSELGLTNTPNIPFWGITVPARTPDAVVNRLNSEFVQLFREPKFNEVLDNNYCEAAVGTPEEFAAFLKADRELAGTLVRKYNLPRR